MTRDGLVALLRHQEAVVRSAECRFAAKRTPTRPEAVPLLRRVCADAGRESDYARYVYSPEMAHAQSYYARWWRLGEKERMEKSPLAEDGAPAENGEPSQIEVLGGKDVRSMSRTDEGVFASIEAPQRWYSVNRTQPTSFLYEFQNKPYSDLIARSPHCEITAVDRGGRPHVRVYFHHPDFYPLDSSSFVLLFDPDDLLVERDCIVKLLRDRAPRVYEKHTFSDYRACGDSSGEQIRFPYRAVYHYYAGDLPDGSHVEYTAEDIRIVEIKFNVPIPDDRFALEFPKDARVYDEVSGVGWLDEAAKRAGSAAELTRPVGRTRWVLILVTTLLVLLVAVLLWRDRRRAQ